MLTKNHSRRRNNYYYSSNDFFFIVSFKESATKFPFIIPSFPFEYTFYLEVIFERRFEEEYFC